MKTGQLLSPIVSTADTPSNYLILHLTLSAPSHDPVCLRVSLALFKGSLNQVQIDTSLMEKTGEGGTVAVVYLPLWTKV